MSHHVATEPVKPVPLTAYRDTGKVASTVEPVFQTGADRRNRSLESAKETLGFEPDNTSAVRATIAAQKHAGGQIIEIGENESMLPQPTQPALRAGIGTGRPRIISLAFEKLLEIDWNTDYHGNAHLIGIL